MMESQIAKNVGLTPGMGKIRVLDELESGQYPIEIHIHRKLLIEANAKMRPRDAADEASVASIIDAVIYLTAAAILRSGDDEEERNNESG